MTGVGVLRPEIREPVTTISLVGASALSVGGFGWLLPGALCAQAELAAKIIESEVVQL
jgi:hypothetical protein